MGNGKITASVYPYTILCKAGNGGEIYPYLRSIDGDKKMQCISPYHGRSFIVGKHEDGKYIVSKGNGLSFLSITSYTQVNLVMILLDCY